MSAADAAPPNCYRVENTIAGTEPGSEYIMTVFCRLQAAAVQTVHEAHRTAASCWKAIELCFSLPICQFSYPPRRTDSQVYEAGQANRTASKSWARAEITYESKACECKIYLLYSNYNKQKKTERRLVQ
ncbi:hypothetical protein CGZ75_16975 [Paenibacillus herberti]|uniref:Uncharacterized protein n=1 Tax=Paenibacillus herberti TaxID=1619309 RepID=A0A229NXG2_9BACL|nr:hypothetical protein CGZ75_16975 [Paenibacillus herberti]